MNNNPYEMKEDTAKPVASYDNLMPQDIREQKAANQPASNPFEVAAMQANNPYLNGQTNNGMAPPNPYYAPPPPPIMRPAPPQVIYVYKQQIQIGPCPHCKSSAGIIDEKKPGIATWSWCVVGACLGGICCFWIPFVIDDCYDHEIRCTSCRRVRQVIRSDFCCCD